MLLAIWAAGWSCRPLLLYGVFCVVRCVIIVLLFPTIPPINFLSRPRCCSTNNPHRWGPSWLGELPTVGVSWTSPTINDQLHVL